MSQNYVSILIAPEKVAFGVQGLNLLTVRERQILQMVVNGSSDREASVQAEITVRTIETHKRNIKNKLGVRSMIEVFQILYALAVEDER